jgi:hypothetical protein
VTRCDAIRERRSGRKPGLDHISQHRKPHFELGLQHDLSSIDSFFIFRHLLVLLEFSFVARMGCRRWIAQSVRVMSRKTARTNRLLLDVGSRYLTTAASGQRALSCLVMP